MLPPAEVAFNYLGQFDQQLSADGNFTLASEARGPSRGLQNWRRYLLDVNSSVIDRQLRVIWTYSSSCYHRSTIQQLADRFIQKLRELIEHCRSRQTTEYTPSDFPLARLEQHKLDVLNQAAEPIADLYPLSPI